MTDKEAVPFHSVEDVDELRDKLAKTTRLENYLRVP
jgi:hypothetical protein